MTDDSVVGEAGAELVKVTLDRLGRPIKFEIDDLIFQESDKQLISDLFVAAFNRAMDELTNRAVDELSSGFLKHGSSGSLSDPLGIYPGDLPLPFPDDK